MTRTLVLVARAATLAGLLAFVAALLLDPKRAFASYLVAWTFMLTIALGALVLLAIGHSTKARWFVLMRRLCEGIAATLPLVALLFLPVFFGLGKLYPWARSPESLTPVLREAVMQKRGWLGTIAFAARSVIYLASWCAIGQLLRRWSRESDKAPSEHLTRRQRALSAIAMPVLLFTGSFASFDWLMSLEPEWHSTIFGIYVLAGSFLAAHALVVLMFVNAAEAGILPHGIDASHFHAQGKVLLAATIFWAYVAFSQLLIIWIANLPEEVGFYLHRSYRGWGALSAALGLLHFAMPLMALLQRAVTREPRRLRAVALLLLVAHYVDVYWLVMPSLYPQGTRTSWIDAAALSLVLGASALFATWRLARVPVVPLNDPALDQALAYRTQ